MFCGKCGKSIPDGSQSCPFCRAQIEPAQPTAPAPPPEATAPMPAQPGVTAPIQPQAPPPPAYQQPFVPPPQYPAPMEAPRSSGSGALIAALVAVLLLVLVGGGVGGYIVINKLRAKPPVQTTDQPPVIQEGPGAPQSGTPDSTGPPDERPVSGGAAQLGAGLDALVGQWRVEMAQLDGPPPTTLTMVRQGDTVVGTLNDRINTHLDLRQSGGDMDYEGAWTDPQVGTAPVEAVLMPEGTLEVFILDGSGGGDLLLSVSRAGSSPPDSGGGGGAAVTSPAQAEGLIADMPDVREWQANVAAASQPGARRTAHIEVDGEQADRYLVHVYEMVQDEYGGHTATFGWYHVFKSNGRVEDATEDM